MLRRLLLIVVLLGFIQTPRPSQIPTNTPKTENSLYMPLMFSGYSQVDVIQLGEVDWFGYPGDICLYGYTTGLSSSSVYSVTLGIDVIVYPYCDPFDDCPPYHRTDYTTPVLSATLPSQKNPFSYCLLYTKGYYGYGSLFQVSGTNKPPGGQVVYPLAVTNVTQDGSGWDTTVNGTVNNNSGQRLTNVRVVGIAGLCSPKEADLGATTLDSGQETGFIFDHFYCATPPFLPPQEAMLEISAQGVVEP